MSSSSLFNECFLSSSGSSLGGFDGIFLNLSFLSSFSLFLGQFFSLSFSCVLISLSGKDIDFLFHDFLLFLFSDGCLHNLWFMFLFFSFLFLFSFFLIFSFFSF